MKRSVSIAELKVMSASRQEDELTELIRSTRRAPNGELTQLDGRIAELEAKHGISSAELVEGISSGRLRETQEFCSWLITLQLRDRLASLTSRSR